MHSLPRHLPQLRYPLADILARGIELLALQQGIENAEVGLGIDAGAGAEAPAAVVRRPVAVDQVLHEVDLAEAPVQEQVLGEEGGGDHAAPVVHVARGVELAHGGVDDRVAGVAGGPGVEEGGGVFPGDVGVFGFEGFVHAVRVLACGGLTGCWGGDEGRITRCRASGRGRACRSRARRLRRSSLRCRGCLCRAVWCC